MNIVIVILNICLWTGFISALVYSVDMNGLFEEKLKRPNICRWIYLICWIVVYICAFTLLMMIK